MAFGETIVTSLCLAFMVYQFSPGICRGVFAEVDVIFRPEYVNKFCINRAGMPPLTWKNKGRSREKTPKVLLLVIILLSFRISDVVIQLLGDFYRATGTFFA